MEDFIRLVTYLLAISIAVERGVDIFKRLVVQRYNWNTYNGALFQIVSGLFGAILVASDRPTFDFITPNRDLLLVILALGVSGGSGVWNTVLEILKGLSQPAVPVPTPVPVTKSPPTK